MFRLSRNEHSRWSGNGVHVEPKSVLMTGRNMQRVRILDAFEQFRRQQWNVDRHCFIRHSASLTKMVWVVNSHIRG